MNIKNHMLFFISLSLLLTGGLMNAYGTSEIQIISRTGDLKLTSSEGQEIIVLLGQSLPEIPFGSRIEAINGGAEFQVQHVTISLSEGQIVEIRLDARGKAIISSIKGKVKGKERIVTVNSGTGEEQVSFNVLSFPQAVGSDSSFSESAVVASEGEGGITFKEPDRANEQPSDIEPWQRPTAPRYPGVNPISPSE